MLKIIYLNFLVMNLVFLGQNNIVFEIDNNKIVKTKFNTKTAKFKIKNLVRLI